MTQDWSLETLAKATELLCDLLQRAGSAVVIDDIPGDHECRIEPAQTFELAPLTLSATATSLRYVASLYREFLDPFQPAHAAPTSVAASAEDNASLQSRYARRVRLCLSFPDLFVEADIELAGEVGFYRDVQSIILQCALFELLDVIPSMPGGSISLGEADAPTMSEHDVLLLTMLGHVSAAWRHDPSHQTHLRGQILDYLGDARRSGACKRLAFVQTPRDAHEYLTKAQIFWSHLMDVGDFQAARSFVLEVYRDARPEHLDELQVLLDETEEARRERRLEPVLPVTDSERYSTRRRLGLLKSTRRTHAGRISPFFRAVK